MSGHKKWHTLNLDDVPNPETGITTAAYVKGYILALEDILCDMDDDNITYAWQVEAIVEQSLESARRTLEILQ